MRRRRFICIRLSNPYMTCSSVTPFNRGRSPPQLLTEAAPGCLKPSPTRGLRRAHLHLSYSTTLARLLDTTCHTTVHAGPHTAVQRVTHRHRTGEVDQANQSKRWEAQDTGPDCSPDAKGRVLLLHAQELEPHKASSGQSRVFGKRRESAFPGDLIACRVVGSRCSL